MTYTEMLNEIIEKSGLSANEICRRIQSDGIDLKSTYLSEVRNESARRMSDEKNRAIAKVCGYPEDWLVTQARLDDNTEMINKVFANLRDSVEAVVQTFFAIYKQPKWEEKAKAIMAKFSDIEFLEVAAQTDMKPYLKMLSKLIKRNFSVDALNELDAMGEFPVGDDGMAPNIPKGGEVTVETGEYNDGDILCYHQLGCDIYCVRQARFLNSEHTEIMMIPYNRLYQSEIFNANDIVIYGRVKQFTVYLG